VRGGLLASVRQRANRQQVILDPFERLNAHLRRNCNERRASERSWTSSARVAKLLRMTATLSSSIIALPGLRFTPWWRR
jgi:hypothetical protein